MKDDGGPAFPNAFNWGTSDNPILQTGATLRDYFATAAIREATLGSPDLLGAILGKIGGEMEEQYKEEIKKIAHYAYVMADAMMAERSKE